MLKSIIRSEYTNYVAPHITYKRGLSFVYPNIGKDKQQGLV